MPRKKNKRKKTTQQATLKRVDDMSRLAANCKGIAMAAASLAMCEEMRLMMKKQKKETP